MNKDELLKIKEYALEKNLNIYQPEKIKNNEEFVEELKKLQNSMK